MGECGFSKVGNSSRPPDAERRVRVLEACLETISEAVAVAGEDGRIELVNPGFEALTGYSAADVIGLPLDRLRDSGRDRAALADLAQALEAGRVWTGGLTCVRRDGRRLDTEQTVRVARRAGRGSGNVILAIRDATERNGLLRAANRAAAAKLEFTAMITHELRTPLTAIKEGVELVSDGLAGPLKPTQAEFLELAVRNVNRLNRVIDQLLDYALLERGRQSASFAFHDMNQVAAAAVSKHRAAARRVGAEITLRTSSDLPPVRMDRKHVQQVLTNLIDNAVRYCEGRSIDVSIRKDGDRGIATVADRGPGISPENLGRVFDAYVQLSAGPEREVGGAGLGLAICRKLVSLHGGAIWATSAPGEGAAFHVALPLASPAASEGGIARSG